MNRMVPNLRQSSGRSERANSSVSHENSEMREKDGERTAEAQSAPGEEMNIQMEETG